MGASVSAGVSAGASAAGASVAGAGVSLLNLVNSRASTTQTTPLTPPSQAQLGPSRSSGPQRQRPQRAPWEPPQGRARPKSINKHNNQPRTSIALYLFLLLSLLGGLLLGLLLSLLLLVTTLERCKELSKEGGALGALLLLRLSRGLSLAIIVKKIVAPGTEQLTGLASSAAAAGASSVLGASAEESAAGASAAT